MKKQKIQERKHIILKKMKRGKPRKNKNLIKKN